MLSSTGNQEETISENIFDFRRICKQENPKGIISDGSARRRFSRGDGIKAGMVDDRLEYPTATDHVGAAPGFHLESKTAAVDFHELGDGGHGYSSRNSLDVVHFDAHAYGD
jgi:hypothetical protein